MTITLMIISTGLGIGYSSGFPAKSQEDYGSLDHGMGHMESRPVMRHHCRCCTVHSKDLCTFTRIV